MSKTVGVLGGMGPEATGRFFAELVRWTPAARDQDHLKIVVVSDPKIPDRSSYLLGTGDSPLPLLLQAADDLQRLGADFIAIPCNTAHCFWESIRQHVQIPVLHIIRETADRVARSFAGHRTARGIRVGLLATEGTIRSRLYQDGLNDAGISTQEPDPEGQAWISESIRLLKARTNPGRAQQLIESTIQRMENEHRVDGVILGCTELGLVAPRSGIPVFDSLEILARSAVRFALKDEETIPRNGDYPPDSHRSDPEGTAGTTSGTAATRPRRSGEC